MENNKTKGYLLIAGIIAIVLIPIIYIVSNKLKSEELIQKGIKTEATVVGVSRSRNFKTSTFNYSLALKYKDENGNVFEETIPVNYDNFRGKGIGQKIEILYLPENPQEINLVDYQKLYNTEERVLGPNDLLAFYENNSLESVYSELNKISNGWLLDQNDSTLFINSRRNSFIYVRKDSIAYFTGVKNETAVKSKLNLYKRVKSEVIKRAPKNINPFQLVELPKNDFEMPMPTTFYEKDDWNLYSTTVVDYSSKPWFSLVLKKSIANNG
ncbi:DUF3592 domain-containing protein [Cellulophaga omnivescoria]|uniref:DUF3592 domain-containing protein n=1 Tax=Cellulophaga omnivescoria TaxID=1888890 RepID=UPI00098526D2|nr:DUF3592 domain-containing protein [Cellulophaga omnivescoria]